MALSPAMQWALNNGMTEADVYKNINDFLATNPNAAQTQSQMAQFGISPEDVAAATGGKSGGLLGGNIMAGASWNSTNTALQNALTEATGQQTSNYAVGGSTTSDTLNQLNTFLAGGGQFDPNATVYLQAGGVDFIQGVDKGVVKDNLNQIVKTLGDQGVNVVLTGSPYAKSIDDVINNNFDPKVDQIYNDVAKANSNVALVGTQGEILQNKKLLVDALHTNAEGTAIYNQSVIDALSQFKNEVPSSTPQAIAQVQQTNTVATTPPIITQAAASPVVAQALGVQAPNIQELIASGALQPNQATLIGDTYYQPIYTQIGSGEDAQLGPLENVITYKANENQAGGAYKQYTPTGELERVGTQQKVASFAGGLAEMLNDPVIQAALLGGGAGGALGNLLGLTGSTAQAVGTGLFKGSAALAGGADIQDALKTGLLSGGLVYGGSELAKTLNTAGGAVLGDASDIAMQMADAGKTLTEIETTLTNSGFSADVVAESLKDAANTLAPKAINIPSTVSGLTDAVNVVSQSATPSLSNVLSTIAAAAPVAVSTPVTDAEAVKVTAPKTTGMTTQEVINLVESQLAANKGTAPTNLADVQVTGGRPATTQEIANAVIASVPNITTQQAQTIAEQVIASGKPVTNQEIVNAVTAAIPALTPTTTPTTLATQTITAPKAITTQEIVNAITAAVPAVTTPVTTPTTTPLATQTITGQKPATVQEIVNAITATIPTVTPAQAQTVAQQVITSNRPVTTQEVINAITAAIPSVIAPTTDPRVTITADRPSSIVDAVTAATIPLIQPSTPLTAPQVTAQTTTPTIDPLRAAQLAVTTAGLLGAGSALSGGSTATQYPVVPVPESWTTPITGTTGTTAYPQLPAINFGDRNLLRGTQWEKFLDPNYGKVPALVQYSQPSNLSYNDLMGILGSKQGMPAKSSLSINDIISGIQNQYGQTPASTMG